MSNCLHPTSVWICGSAYCKADHVLSKHMEFSATKALGYFLGCTGDLCTAQKLMDAAKIDVPCGKCFACLITKRKHMATRLANEAMMHEQACFITLTYNDDNIPVTDWNPLSDESKEFSRGLGELPERTLFVSDVQKFLKRLRRHLEYIPKRISKQKRDHVDHPIRYFACGEYGTKTKRPHYHIMIFGWRPSDLEPLKVHNGNLVYTSKQLQKLWKFGFSSVSDVNTAVAQYAARYVTKKFARLEQADPWEFCKVPEFTLQSTRHGGIGAPWCDRYGANACSKRFVELRKNDGSIIKVSCPPYYWHRLRRTRLPFWLKLRKERLEFVQNNPRLGRTYEEIQRHCEVMREFDRQSADREFF